jgi:hypothetical protein
MARKTTGRTTRTTRTARAARTARTTPATGEGRVVVTINQQDMTYTQEQLGVNMETADNEVLTAVRGMVGEQLQDGAGEFTFAVRRALNSNTIYVYPKPGFGA